MRPAIISGAFLADYEVISAHAGDWHTVVFLRQLAHNVTRIVSWGRGNRGQLVGFCNFDNCPLIFRFDKIGIRSPKHGTTNNFEQI